MPCVQIQRQVSGMVMIDLLFWKTTTVVDEIKGDYFVRWGGEGPAT